MVTAALREPVQSLSAHAFSSNVWPPMCGISGIVTKGPAPDLQALQRMMASMVHRGPDDSGTFSDHCCGLGVRRLSIIDVAGGHQPIFSEDRSLVIAFNGEVYNYRDLASRLERLGHRFSTRSDSEAVLHAYEEWGPGCLERLRGMFAFAVWDARQGRLFAARDRLGIKPLYWTLTPGGFLFASEVRALLASDLFQRALSPSGLASYLAYGSVQEPETLIEGVWSLPPGHCLVTDGREPSLREYWELPEADPGGSPPARHEVVVELRRLLEEAVSLRLISEVPLGAFLSSGLDSTAVVSLMSGIAHRPVSTFTVTFREREFNEGELAGRVARRLGTDHHEVEITPQQVLEELPQALAAMDQPTIDGVNTYYVSRAARHSGMTVALSGLGGDELFGGYPSFRLVPRLTALDRVLSPLPGPVRAVAASALRQVRGRSEQQRKAADFVAGAHHAGHPYFTVRSLFSPARGRALLDGRDGVVGNGAWRERLEHLGRRAALRHPFAAVSYLEARSYLASTLLRDTDFMSMAHSLEVRVPLIDHRVVEFVHRLPESVLRQFPGPKGLLVAALGDDLPRDVLDRPKRTFTFPWERWLRAELRARVAGRLTDRSGPLVGHLDPGAIRTVWEDFLSGRTSWSRVWGLYVLSQWCQRYLS